MIPIRDENQLPGKPYVVWALIGLNVLVYLFQLSMDQQEERFFLYYLGVVPAWLTGLGDFSAPADWFFRPFTLLSYQFVHGGFWHLAGNMLYLYIFGDNIELTLGRLRFIGFYLLGGVLAALIQVLSGPASQLPMVGASGAIAAVLGAYLALYPKNRVLVLFWFIIIVTTVRVPAVFLLGFWFFLQVMGSGGTGVAWMAHVGGFVCGLLLVRFFMPRVPPLRRPPDSALH